MNNLLLFRFSIMHLLSTYTHIRFWHIGKIASLRIAHEQRSVSHIFFRSLPLSHSIFPVPFLSLSLPIFYSYIQFDYYYYEIIKSDDSVHTYAVRFELDHGEFEFSIRFFCVFVFESNNDHTMDFLVRMDFLDFLDKHRLQDHIELHSL